MTTTSEITRFLFTSTRFYTERSACQFRVSISFLRSTLVNFEFLHSPDVRGTMIEVGQMRAHGATSLLRPFRSGRLPARLRIPPNVPSGAVFPIPHCAPFTLLAWHFITQFSQFTFLAIRHFFHTARAIVQSARNAFRFRRISRAGEGEVRGRKSRSTGQSMYRRVFLILRLQSIRTDRSIYSPFGSRT